MTQKRETDLGPPVIAWLEDEGFTVYQEVAAWSGVADLVGVCGPLVAVVELKMVLSWELLAQARRWRGVAHQVWVAVPHAKRSDGRQMAERVFEREGLGVLEVSPRGVETRGNPTFNRRAEVQRVKRYLHDEQKTYAAAGSHGGRHWTEFKATCERLRRYLAEKPGATLCDVVRDVRHHYASGASARAHLVALIKRGVIEGIKIEKEGRTPRLYLLPTGNEAGHA